MSQTLKAMLVICTPQPLSCKNIIFSFVQYITTLFIHVVCVQFRLCWMEFYLLSLQRTFLLQIRHAFGKVSWNVAMGRHTCYTLFPERWDWGTFTVNMLLCTASVICCYHFVIHTEQDNRLHSSPSTHARLTSTGAWYKHALHMKY